MQICRTVGTGALRNLARMLSFLLAPFPLLCSAALRPSAPRALPPSHARPQPPGPTQTLQDPYLMLDELKSPAKQAVAGFPEHPHRG